MRITPKQRRGLAIAAFIPVVATAGALGGALLVMTLSPTAKLQEHIKRKQHWLWLKRTGQLPKKAKP